MDQTNAEDVEVVGLGLFFLSFRTVDPCNPAKRCPEEDEVEELWDEDLWTFVEHWISGSIAWFIAVCGTGKAAVEVRLAEKESVRHG